MVEMNINSIENYHYRNRFLKDATVGCGDLNVCDLIALFTYEIRCVFPTDLLLTLKNMLDNNSDKIISTYDIKGFEVIELENFTNDKVAMARQEAFNGIDAPASCYMVVDADLIRNTFQKGDVVLKYYWNVVLWTGAKFRRLFSAPCSRV